ncbi:MAG: hypothetical protein SFW07_05815 [Gammaproteobacteria bacterium]|nr:hypothetical protein [Gammaproteobacteria bacterium]
MITKLPALFVWQLFFMGSVVKSTVDDIKSHFYSEGCAKKWPEKIKKRNKKSFKLDG